MSDAVRPRVLSERWGRWLLNLFPPFLFNRIRVLEIAPGFRACRVGLGKSLRTRNFNGTTFGGAIFSAAEPFHAVMYWQVLARRGIPVRVWVKGATIAYLRPAESALTIEFRLGDDDVAEALAALAATGRFVKTFRTEALDRRGQVCARVETEVYLRLSGKSRREGSAF